MIDVIIDKTEDDEASAGIAKSSVVKKYSIAPAKKSRYGNIY